LDQLPYCGSPPSADDLLSRFNTDPTLIGVLITIAISQAAFVANTRASRGCTLTGWLTVAAALLSPLCALSVSLFSARIAQHMILLLIAAPLIALGWPRIYRRRRRGKSRSAQRLWLSTGAFFITFWFWHMPRPYDLTFSSALLYWLMHVMLLGSGVFLWREMLHHRPGRTIDVLTAGALSAMQMGLLGAVLAFAARPMFWRHLTTTATWDLTPLRDQQLGGVILWIPAATLLLWAAIRLGVMGPLPWRSTLRSGR
jgi:putative membrane protein